ncbi:MAG: hypothetical protein GQ558_10955, partial [Thermoplasmata archaeon]|nr:hypothetical protein [Thermoplasmata archaeon]
MNNNIRNVSKRSVNAMIVVPMIAMLLLSLGPVTGLPDDNWGTVKGTVTDINNGEPIVGAEVTISYHGIVRTDITDTSGTYEFTRVPICYCMKTINATKDGYRPESKDVGVQVVTVVDFELMHEEMEPTEGSVSGIVTNADTGLPIEGASMTLEYHGNTLTSVTDADGAYAFTGIPICYCLKDLSVEADGYEDQARQVAVAEGTIEDFALEPEDGGSNGLYGIVTDIVTDASTNGPIAGALVTLEYHDIVRTTVTDADGRYAFQ